MCSMCPPKFKDHVIPEIWLRPPDRGSCKSKSLLHSQRQAVALGEESQPWNQPEAWSSCTEQASGRRAGVSKEPRGSAEVRLGGSLLLPQPQKVPSCEHLCLLQLPPPLPTLSSLSSLQENSVHAVGMDNSHGV